MTKVIKSHLSDFDVRVTFSLLSDLGKIKSLRELLTRYKNQHDDLPKIVETDAGKEGWGVVLKQVRIKENKKKSGEILQFASRVCQDAKKNYAALDKEIKAALNALQKFEIFLINKKICFKNRCCCHEQSLEQRS